MELFGSGDFPGENDEAFSDELALFPEMNLDDEMAWEGMALPSRDEDGMAREVQEEREKEEDDGPTRGIPPDLYRPKADGPGFEWVQDGIYFSVEKECKMMQAFKKRKTVWYFNINARLRKGKPFASVVWHCGEQTLVSDIDLLFGPDKKNWTGKATRAKEQPDAHVVRFSVDPFHAPKNGANEESPKLSRSALQSKFLEWRDRLDAADADEEKKIIADFERIVKKAKHGLEGDIAYYFPRGDKTEAFRVGDVVAIVDSGHGRRVYKHLPEGTTASWWSVVANVDGQKPDWPQPFHVSNVLRDLCDNCVPVVILGVAGVNLSGIDHLVGENGSLIIGQAHFQLLARDESGQWARVWVGGESSDYGRRLKKMSRGDVVQLLQAQPVHAVELSFQVLGISRVARFVPRECTVMDERSENAVSEVKKLLSSASQRHIRIEAPAGCGKSTFLRQLFLEGNDGDVVLFPPIRLTRLAVPPKSPVDLLEIWFQRDVAEAIWGATGSATCVWLFDGLDEVSDPLISDWCLRSPDWIRRRVIGTRPEAASPQGAVTIRLELFSMDAQSSYFRNRLGDEGARLFDSFRWNSFASILGTPLFCELLCTLHENGVDVTGVRNRVELYELLTTWILRRDVTRGFAACHDDESFESVKKELAKAAYDAFVNGRQWIQIKGSCRKASFVFPTDLIRDRFEFCHQTFLEWFAAMHLVLEEDEDVAIPEVWLSNRSILEFARHFVTRSGKDTYRSHLVDKCASNFVRIAQEQCNSSVRIFTSSRDLFAAWHCLNVVCVEEGDQITAISQFRRSEKLFAVTQLFRLPLSLNRSKFIDWLASASWSQQEKSEIVNLAVASDWNIFAGLVSSLISSSGYCLKRWSSHWNIDSVAKLEALERSVALFSVDWSAVAACVRELSLEDVFDCICGKHRVHLPPVLKDVPRKTLTHLVRIGDIEAIRAGLESGRYGSKSLVEDGERMFMTSFSAFCVLQEYKVIVKRDMLRICYGSVDSDLVAFWFHLEATETPSRYAIRDALLLRPDCVADAVKRFGLDLVLRALGELLDTPPAKLMERLWSNLDPYEVDKSDHPRLAALFLTHGYFDWFVRLVEVGWEEEREGESTSSDEDDSASKNVSENEMVEPGENPMFESEDEFAQPWKIFLERSYGTSELGFEDGGPDNDATYDRSELLAWCVASFFWKPQNFALSIDVVKHQSCNGDYGLVETILYILRSCYREIRSTGLFQIIQECFGYAVSGLLRGKFAINNKKSFNLATLPVSHARKACTLLSWRMDFIDDFAQDPLDYDGHSADDWLQLTLRLPFPANHEARDPLCFVKRMIQSSICTRLVPAMLRFGHLVYENGQAIGHILKWIADEVSQPDSAVLVEQDVILGMLKLCAKFPQYVGTTLLLFIRGYDSIPRPLFSSLWYDLLSSEAATCCLSTGVTLLKAICDAVHWDEKFWREALDELVQPQSVSGVRYDAVLELSKVSPWASKRLLCLIPPFLRRALAAKVFTPDEAIFWCHSSMIEICLKFGAKPVHRLIPPKSLSNIMMEMVPLLVPYVLSPLGLVGKFIIQRTIMEIVTISGVSLPEKVWISPECPTMPPWLSDSLENLSFLESKGAEFQILQDARAASVLQWVNEHAAPELREFLAQRNIHMS